MTVHRTIAPDGLTLTVTNDDPFIGLEAAASHHGVTTGVIRELIEANAVRRKVVRLLEERWLVEHYIVSSVDVQTWFDLERFLQTVRLA